MFYEVVSPWNMFPRLMQLSFPFRISNCLNLSFVRFSETIAIRSEAESQINAGHIWIWWIWKIGVEDNGEELVYGEIKLLSRT